MGMTQIVINGTTKFSSMIARLIEMEGLVKIGRNSFIGMNSTIKNRISLPPFTLVGCGSNVIKNVEDERCIVVGNPAKVLIGKESIIAI